MPKLIDLHTHTTASDGSDTPSKLIELAKESGLCAIAVTDHDSIDGLEEALKKGAELNFEVVPGIELSCEYQRELHIVGLYIDYNNEKLKEKLVDLEKKRATRNLKTLDILNSLGFLISLEDVHKIATGKIWGRAHFARLLYEKGIVSSTKEAFQKYLGHNRIAYVTEERMEPKECIELIKQAGGIPILAHMHYLKLDDDKLAELLEELKSYGLLGVEVKYTEYTKEQEKNYTKIADKLNLLKSGGSDYHGKMKPQITLSAENLSIPYTFLKEIKEVCQDIQSGQI